MQTASPGLFPRLAAASIMSVGIGSADASTFLYTSSNSPAGNSVIELEQATDGSLTMVAEYPTGGTGTGGGLGNQSAVAYDDEFLFVVDAGSDELSAFRFVDGGLAFADRIGSGGTRPVSVTVDRDVIYVVNADSDNIAGFQISASGEMTPLPASNQPLSGSGTDPAQIAFSKDGRVLIVTEKATRRILTYPVDRHGVAGPAMIFDSPGETPFGFAVTKGRRVLVSEAAGGQPGLSSVTSWKVSPHGALNVLDPAVPTLQTAACWVSVTPNGRFAFTTNTGSDSITAYRVDGDSLMLVDEDGFAAGTGPGGAPIDMAISPDGRFLHALNAGTDSIVSFRIGKRGDLTSVGSLDGLPDGSTGLVAR